MTAKSPLITKVPRRHRHNAATDEAKMDATRTCIDTGTSTSIEDQMNSLTIHSNANALQQEQEQEQKQKPQQKRDQRGSNSNGSSERSASGHASSTVNSNSNLNHASAAPTSTGTCTPCTPFDVNVNADATDASSIIHVVDENDAAAVPTSSSLRQTPSTSTIISATTTTTNTTTSTKKSLKRRLRKMFRKRPGRKKSSRQRGLGGSDSQSELSTQNSMLSLGTIDLESNRSGGATLSQIDVGGTGTGMENDDFQDVDYPDYPAYGYDSNYEYEAEYDDFNFNPDDEYRNHYSYGGNIMTMRLYEGDESEHYSIGEDTSNNSRKNHFGIYNRSYSSPMNTNTKKSHKDHGSVTTRKSLSPTPTLEDKSYSKTTASTGTSASTPASASTSAHTPLSKSLNAIDIIDDGIVPSEVSTGTPSTKGIRLQTPPSWQQQWQRQQSQIRPLHQNIIPTLSKQKSISSIRDDNQHQSSLYEMGKSYYAQGMYDKAFTAQMEALQSLYDQFQNTMLEAEAQSKSSKSQQPPQSHPHLRQEAMIRYEIAKIKYAHYMERTANSDGNPYDQSNMRKIRRLQDRVESTKCQVSLQNLHFYQCHLQNMDARVEGNSGSGNTSEGDGDGEGVEKSSFDLNDVYQRLHILHTLGKLCNEGLHRYEDALSYYQRALDIEDQMMQLWKRGCLNSITSVGSSKSINSTSMMNNVASSSSDNDAEMREWAARIRHSRMKIGSIHYTRGRFDLALYSST